MPTKIDLGSEAEVRRLFSYPNNFNEAGFLDQRLEETIQVYLKSSAKRDGFNDATFDVRIDGGNVQLTITGGAEDPYSKLVPGLLSAGRAALDASHRLNGEKRWLYNWRFFLPLGLAMAAHKTVQLLHFPPDYVLERDQDYLLAHTTTRWSELLEENGANADDTVRYQTIVDIAPIAAPSNAGTQLEGIYDHFTKYILALLNLWIPKSSGVIRPMVAFGGPVRAWLKAVFELDLPVLSVGKLKLDKLEIPVLGANHPSFIYNAVKRLDDANTPTQDKVVKAMRIMQQDLIAADWQVRMAADPGADADDVLEQCKADWSKASRQGRICELTYEQAFDTSEDEAKKLCAVLPTVHVDLLAGTAPDHRVQALDESIDALRQQLGALESREPDHIHAL